MSHPRTRQTVPFGAWPSPVTAEMLTAQTLRLSAPGSDGADRYWLEARASEGGISRLVRQRGQGDPEPITSLDLNVRSAVHEYGGGAWAARNGIVVVSSSTDNRLYRVADDTDPAPITPDTPHWRYADLLLDPERNRIIAVREDHSMEEAEPVNTLVTLDLHGPNEDGGRVLVSGTDFVASPALSADGRHLAWLSWDHPLMPWDGTELWTAELGKDAALSGLRHIAGDARESVFQPRWAADGDLVFVSDRTGWWNLYRQGPNAGEAAPLCPMEAEFGLPQLAFGMSTWDFAPDGGIVCAWTRHGTWSAGRLPAEGGAPEPFELPFTVIRDVHVQAETGEVLMIASSPVEPAQVVALEPGSGAWTALRTSMEVGLPDGSISIPEPISWPSAGGATAHGFFYPPTSADVSAPEGERPPLIVKSHGGPTAMTNAELDLGIQFWTSRGFAVLDVNYGGSTGYGRAYRERLIGAWGIVDVEDCIAGATWLAGQGRVDGNRMTIKGGSAGGYTTLAALCFHDTFRSGVSSYGVADLEALARDTHKFESRYLDSLVGPYPAERARYRERSPIHHVERLHCAMLLFQGLEDTVVPPSQAETMAQAVRDNGMPVALITFESEGHGFRQAETIRRVLEAELSFHSQLFDIPHPEGITPLRIENMREPQR
jgi:dipeptidyl aminopeptidase/acylaminoacyl peptidase